LAQDKYAEETQSRRRTQTATVQQKNQYLLENGQFDGNYGGC